MTATTTTAVPGFARELLSLCKPRISLMVTATGIAGALAAPERPKLAALAALLGTLLVIAGANTLNMWIERESDARMERTRERPIASGRISPAIGLLFGITLTLASLPLLALTSTLVALLGALAWLAYVALYTPLKRRTRWALPLGAIAGAMPPLMGWVASTGGIDAGGAYLFALLFFWQLPHFEAIAIVRADEYAAAGLPVGRSTRATLVLSAALFVAVTVMTPLGGQPARWVAVVTGSAFLLLCVRAARSSTRNAARDVFAFTMAHLAILLVAFGVR